MLKPGDLSLILHQFNNILQPICYRAEQLGDLRVDNPIVKDISATLNERLASFNRTIERLRILAKPVVIQNGWVNLFALLKSVWSDISSEHDMQPIASRIDASALNGVARGDEFWLHLAFREILTNAAEAALRSTVPEIQIRIESVDAFWRVEISDSGTGIPQDALVAELFRSTKAQSGAGLGLPLALHIFQAHDARVSIDGSGRIAISLRRT